MIKKIALFIIIVLFIFGTFNVYKNGLTFSSVNALSYESITKKNAELNTAIANLNNLNKTEYGAMVSKLESAKSNFDTNQKAYETLAASASEKDIAEANKEEKYLLDYLWIKVGNYANENDIKVLIDPDISNRLVNFDVTGSYISIINFIYDLENDEELAFDVDNLIMEGADTADTKATFTVSNVLVVTKEQ